MTPSSSVTTWIGLLRQGDADAAEALWQRYFAQLVELARQHLAKNVRQAADEEDVALAAFAGFCNGVATCRFPRLSNRHDLWRLLLAITLNHARKLARHEISQQRDRKRTITAADLFDVPEADLDRLAGPGPDPALAAEVADELRHLLTALPGDELRTVARDLLAGYTAPEIARRQGLSLRTIERRWQRIRQLWAPAHDQEPQ